MRPLCILIFAVLSAAASATSQGDGSGGGIAPPNVLIVIADDLGYGDVGAFGSQLIATPHIDGICADGVRMTSFYAHSTCSPSRAALLTGRYAQRIGLPGPIGTWSQRGLSPDETTIAEVLGPVGYRSAQFGKWHVGDGPEQQATGQGFDEFRGLLWGPTGIPLVLADSVQGTLEYEPDLADDFFDVTSHSLDFIDRAVTDGDPFFCIASYVAPHEPATASPAFQGVSADGRDYGDSVEELDHSVGLLLDHIATLGIDESTLVVFLSDNGATYQRIPYQDGSNLPFSNGKGTTFEGGVRVPACARWTGTIPPGLDVDAPLSITDLFPTIAAYGGATLDPAITIDGLDIGAILEGGPADPNRVVHLSDGGGFNAVRRGRYKLRQGQLFDLEADPEELVDVSAMFPTVAAELALELDAIIASVALDNRPASLSTRLTARFRGDFGLPSDPVDGDRWFTLSLDDRSLLLEDTDPLVDPARIEVPDAGTANTPRKAIHVPELSDGIRLTGPIAGLDPLGAFTVTFWYRPVVGGPGEAIALLDVGDADAGLSITIGDGGIAGDDT
ncbi:MAG: sulfatase-like hydrolase/transferase, partial [Planctomycetota bacterium]